MPLSPKRAEIADAALRIIGSRGIAALTTATLAAELGVSSGAPFRHFASLDDILEAAAQRTEEILRSTSPDPGLPPLARLEQLFLARAETVGQHAWVARSSSRSSSPSRCLRRRRPAWWAWWRTPA